MIEKRYLINSLPIEKHNGTVLLCLCQAIQLKRLVLPILNLLLLSGARKIHIPAGLMKMLGRKS